MAETDVASSAEGDLAGGCLLWTLWGGILGATTLCSLILLVLFVGSLALNAYLGLELSGVEVVLNLPPPEAPVLDSPASVDGLAEAPEGTPEPNGEAVAENSLEEQVATLAVVATDVASEETEIEASGFDPPGDEEAIDATPVPTAVAMDPNALAIEAGGADSGDQSMAAAGLSAPGETFGLFELIPLEGERVVSGDTDLDLNLMLREPQPVELALELIDIPDAGIDPDAPNFSDVFDDNFTSAYTIRDNGDFVGEPAILVGIATEPGSEVRTPSREADIYEGRFVAVVLYATEDSVTFTYARSGSVAMGYTIHYQGLNTDPDLLMAYQNGNSTTAPGLSSQMTVGTATDELIVAIRDNGTFLDMRSRKDWWE